MIPRICSALRISRTSLALSIAHHLPGLALWTTFSPSLVGRDSHDYYPGSVTLALAGRRSSHVPSKQYVITRRRCPTHPLGCPHWTRVRPQEGARCIGYSTSMEAASSSSVLTDGCGMAPLEIWVQA